jgi:hypothetical protein
MACQFVPASVVLLQGEFHRIGLELATWAHAVLSCHLQLYQVFTTKHAVDEAACGERGFAFRNMCWNLPRST